MNYQKGFSILFVSLAILIFSAGGYLIYLTLTKAQQQTLDNEVRSNLNQIKVKSEIYFSNHGDFVKNGGGTMCDDPEIQDYFNRALASGAGGACNAGFGAWAVAVGLKNNPGQAYCLDFAGKAGEVSIVDLTGGSSDVADFVGTKCR